MPDTYPAYATAAHCPRTLNDGGAGLVLPLAYAYRIPCSLCTRYTLIDITSRRPVLFNPRELPPFCKHRLQNGAEGLAHLCYVHRVFGHGVRSLFGHGLHGVLGPF